MGKPRITCVVGTRPDAIKSAPVILELKKYQDQCDVMVVATGQHREMLAQALGVFGIKADADLDIMQAGQSLSDITTRTLEGLQRLFADAPPSMVIAQGDTTTTFVSGLAAFYHKIPFGHVEAGLRTNNIWSPFPEEFNRRAVGLFAAMHWAPTAESAQNVLNEGADPATVFITGNTGIDAVLSIAEKSELEWFPHHEGRVILLTTHRRENWGEPQRQIALAALELINEFEDTILAVPMHRNPDVRATLTGVFQDHPRVFLTEPPDYMDFVKLMQRADLILTDSGGVQEEAPAFGRPVLVLRETTERPEGVTAGVAKLVGSDRERIVAESRSLLTNPTAYEKMAQASSPYGDGNAAKRIRMLALRHLGIDSPMETMWT